MKRGRVITIGSFDGVHRGHQALLERTVAEARKRGLRAMALSFAVPPRMVLEASTPTVLLSDEGEKERLLRAYGMDDVEILQFNRKLAATRPFGFFRDVLLNHYGAKGIVVGVDFRFGADRSGGAVDLVRWGVDFGIPVWVIPPVRFRKKIISSTFIRGLLLDGHFKTASEFLGHPYLISGPVVKGRGMGKKIGYPTANIRARPEKILPRGVFAVRASAPTAGRRKETILDGVANIGIRPTFGADARPSIEVHLFCATANLRGKTLSVELIKRLREEKKFPNVEALKRQISRDVLTGRRALAGHKSL